MTHVGQTDISVFFQRHSKTENRLFEKYILSAVTSKSSFRNGDYFGALQIFQITKLSHSDDPTDGAFWCPMFQDIVHTKLGFQAIFRIEISPCVRYKLLLYIGKQYVDRVWYYIVLFIKS